MTSIWNYEDDVVSITFDGKVVEPAFLRRVIEGLGYGVEKAEGSIGASKPSAAGSVSVPESAPTELRAAFSRARSGDRLVVVDSWVVCPMHQAQEDDARGCGREEAP